MRVFCDRQSLGASPELWPSIESSLSKSRHLILLASPESASSPWVNREVELWQGLEPKRPLLIVFTAGALVWDDKAADFDWEQTTALASSLAGWFAHEPLWIDLTVLRKSTDLSVKNPVFLDAVATLAAPVHGRPKDELIGEDVRQHQRARRFRRLSWTGLTTLTLVAVVAALLALDQRQEALTQRQEALAQRDRAVARTLVLEAEALRPTEPDVSALLSVAAWRKADLPDTRSSLLSSQATHQAVALRGHAADVYGVAASPDGALLASTSQDGSVRLWDLAHHKKVVQLAAGGVGFSYAPVFSNDGTVLANAKLGGRVQFWDVRHRRPIALPDLNPAGPQPRSPRAIVMTLRPDGKVLATTTARNTVQLWPTDGSPPSEGFATHGSIRGLAFSPDGKVLAVADDTVLQLWKAATMTQLGAPVAIPMFPRLPGGPALTFSGDGTMLAVADGRDVKLIDVRTGLETHALTTPHQIRAVAFSPDGATLATAGRDDAVRLWEVATRRQRGDALTGHGGDVRSIAFTPIGKSLAAGGSGGRLLVWRLDDSVIGHLDQAVEAVAVTPDGRSLASVAADGSLRLWDLAGARPVPQPSVITTLSLLRIYQRPPKPAARAIFSPDGRMLALSAAGGDVWLWRMDSDSRPFKLTHTPLGIPPTIVFSPDGRLLATTGGDNSVSLWDTSSRRLRLTLRAPDGWTVAALAFTHDGRRLITGAHDIKIWDLSTRQFRSIALDDGDSQYVRALALSHDDSRLVAGDVNGSIHLWQMLPEPRSGGLLVGHRGPILQVQFWNDRLLVSLSGDGSVRAWNPETERHLWSLTGPSDLTSFSIDAKSDRLATGDLDGRIVLGSSNAQEVADSVCGLGDDPLPANEWARLSPGLTYDDICPG